MNNLDMFCIGFGLFSSIGYISSLIKLPYYYRQGVLSWNLFPDLFIYCLVLICTINYSYLLFRLIEIL